MTELEVLQEILTTLDYIAGILVGSAFIQALKGAKL